MPIKQTKDEEKQERCSCSTPSTPRSTPSTPRTISPIVSLNSGDYQLRRPVLKGKNDDINEIVKATKSMEPLVDAIYKDALYTYVKGRDVPQWVRDEVEKTEAQENDPNVSLPNYRE